jgi:hypothetical protein
VFQVAVEAVAGVSSRLLISLKTNAPLTGGNPADQVRETVDGVYRSDSRRVLATPIRLLGDFELAEEALYDAFAAAIQQWPQDGIPANPRAWLVSTGRRPREISDLQDRSVRKLLILRSTSKLLHRLYGQTLIFFRWDVDSAVPGSTNV